MSLKTSSLAFEATQEEDQIFHRIDLVASNLCLLQSRAISRASLISPLFPQGSDDVVYVQGNFTVSF